MPPPARIRAREVARLTGLSLRMVQRRAAAGDIPGAAQLCGIWTFDAAAVRAWISAAEATVAARSAPVMRPRIVSAERRAENEIDEAFQRLIGRVRIKSTHGRPRTR
ncbi:MAG: helix-turn-helix transcriptional regulator [Geminicoccaceae bacterium]